MIGSTGHYSDTIRILEMLNSGELSADSIAMNTSGSDLRTMSRDHTAPMCTEKELRVCQGPWTNEFTNSLTKTDMYADMYEYYTMGHDIIKNKIVEEETYMNTSDAPGFSTDDSDQQERYYSPGLLENSYGQCYSNGQCFTGNIEQNTFKDYMACVKIEDRSSDNSSPLEACSQTTMGRTLSKAGRKRRECLQDLQLSKPELERKERRRAQNRKAAEKCRLKKKAQHVRTLEDYRKSQEVHTQLQEQVRTLEKQRQQLEQQLRRHLSVCHRHTSH